MGGGVDGSSRVADGRLPAACACAQTTEPVGLAAGPLPAGYGPAGRFGTTLGPGSSCLWSSSVGSADGRGFVSHHRAPFRCPAGQLTWRFAVGLQFHIDVRRVRRLSGDVDVPTLALATCLSDQIIVPTGGAEFFEHGHDGGLLWRGEIRISAKILCMDAAGEVRLDRGDGGPGVESSVVNAVGGDDGVGREPVAANVGAFPHQFRPSLTERTPHGPSPHCTAGVMLTMGANEDDRWKALIPGSCQR